MLRDAILRCNPDITFGLLETWWRLLAVEKLYTWNFAISQALDCSTYLLLARCLLSALLAVQLGENKMKKSILALCVLAAVFSAPASATVIDFESTGTSGTYNSLDYAIDGFRFNFTMDNIDVSSTSGWGGTGPAHSGKFAGLNNHGGVGELTRDGGGTFSFQSLWVRNWYDTSMRPGTLVGYLGGVQVGTAAGFSSGTWTEIVGNFAEIDTLRFNFGNYFLIDDITLNNQRDPVDVPEPGSLALLGLGLAGLFAGRKRLRG
jgi:hypothetical protein